MYEIPTDPEGELSDGTAIRRIFSAASIHAFSSTADVSGLVNVRSSMLEIVRGDDIDNVDADELPVLLGWC